VEKPKYYVGIDIASKTYTATIGQYREDKGWEIIAKPSTFENTYDAFSQFIYWLNTIKVVANNCIVCMEATGVYGEALAYFLVRNEYTLVVEAPLRVKRAFDPEGHKSDPVDSRQIAEYAYRFIDQLKVWEPKEMIIEQIKVLLTVREQLVAQRTAHSNANQALNRKVVQTPFAQDIHEKAFKELDMHVQEVEAEINRLINESPSSRELQRLLETVPGIGPILATFLVMTIHSAPEPYNPKALAAYIGICPYENSSGTSRNKRATSRHYGPSPMRRLLYLAAMSVRQHCPKFEHYFLRKVAEGKQKQLVMNNIANKLLKVACAVARTKTPYISGYRSIHPQLLKGN